METILHPIPTQVSVRVYPMLLFTHREGCLSAVGSQRQRHWYEYEPGPNICPEATKEREIARMTRISASVIDVASKDCASVGSQLPARWNARPQVPPAVSQKCSRPPFLGGSNVQSLSRSCERRKENAPVCPQGTRRSQELSAFEALAPTCVSIAVASRAGYVM